MPVNPLLRSLAQDGRVTLREAETIAQAVTAGTVKKSEAKEALSRYGEAFDVDAQALLTDTFQTRARARVSSLPTEQTLQHGDRSDDVRTLQRALMSVALQTQNAGMALGAGADGIFGDETTASIKAFQTANGKTPTGIADPDTLRTLQQALGTRTTTTAPPLPAPSAPARGLARAAAGTEARSTSPTKVPLAPGVKPGTAAAVVDAATTLATGDRALDYGKPAAWKNVDPRHNTPVDVAIGGLQERWKCNLFGGNALAAAGFEPPYYGNKNRGEYAVAEDWHKWSKPTPEAVARGAAEGHKVPDYAAKASNKSRFDLRDEVRLSAMPKDSPEATAARSARIQEFLDRVQPGDVVTADHADSGSDGGHVRVCVGRDPTSNQPLFAQAGRETALVEAEGPAEFMGEENLYLLRPNTPRLTS
ncbi:MAG: peptidoglycan-binding domain-containing protein [Deltaproteobacteria bacterium]|nr:peptidoglycan-binding domain-containing protein [Deltaproteobacteria bacterium]